MRKLILSAFVSLDGVMQAPGGPEEDPVGGFRHGGWVTPLWDEVVDAENADLFLGPFDLVLGRRTYDIFAAHWPSVPSDPTTPGFNADEHAIAKRFNEVTKFVATHDPNSLTWANSQAFGADLPSAVRWLKAGNGPTLLIQGSSELIQQLLAEDLIDEIRMQIFPVVLGGGKRLFGHGAMPAAMKLTHSQVSPKGVVIARYERAGAVDTGSFALETPTAAEVKRREKLRREGR